ncbi:MAG: hypothetical protein Ct9H300mP8_01710 [Gammaproteobacteria bacterium]|nr:MAG: hypothetical protein Ct9H300mP8_01710 [Gammaproteobacteria bacterium]
MGDSVADTSDATWDFMFNLNARTVLNMARAVLRLWSRESLGRSSILVPAPDSVGVHRWPPTLRLRVS